MGTWARSCSLTRGVGRSTTQAGASGFGAPPFVDLPRPLDVRIPLAALRLPRGEKELQLDVVRVPKDDDRAVRGLRDRAEHDAGLAQALLPRIEIVSR